MGSLIFPTMHVRTYFYVSEHLKLLINSSSPPLPLLSSSPGYLFTQIRLGGPVYVQTYVQISLRLGRGDALQFSG